jgi:hypothetical protein
MRVATSVTPGVVYFADRVTARVDVTVDRRLVDPGTITIVASFGSWDQLGPPRETTVESGSAARHTESFTIACLAAGCLPRGTARQSATLPKVVVTARSRDGSRVVLQYGWPALELAGRFLQPTNSGVRPALRRRLDLPAERYRVDPSTAALALDVAGVAGLAAAAALTGLALAAALRRRRPADARSPLERALILLEEAQGRDVDDRRRAAGLVARLLLDHRADRATEAAAIAWSRGEPSPAALGELARSLEHRREPGA